MSQPPTFQTNVFNSSFFEESDSSKPSPFLTGVVAGTAAANKALVVDANRSIRNIGSISTTTSSSFKEVNINGILNTFGSLSIKGEKPSPLFGSSNSLIWMESSHASSPIMAEISVSDASSSTPSNSLRIGTSTDNDIVFFTDNTERLRINHSAFTFTSRGDTANVFQCISGSSTVRLIHTANATAMFGTATSHNFHLLTNNTSRMTVAANGEITIGRRLALNTAPDGRFIVPDSPSATWIAIFRNTGSAGSGISFRNSGNTTIGSIQFNESSIGYNTTSDYRLKKDVEPLEGLSVLKKLNPVKWKWKSDDSYGDGFIAHELQEHCPSVVYGEKDALTPDGKPDYQSVSYSNLIGMIVASIQELSNDLETLKNAKSFAEFKKNI